MMRRRRAGISAISVAAVLLLTGCGASEPEPVRDPYPVDDPLPVVDTAGMRLPAQFEELEVMDPGWDVAAQYADGVYLAPGERDGMLEFTAVDVHGDVLWAVQRPASCTGFAVTIDADGRALAILGDLETTTEALAATTATAYDLATGEQVWGPVQVPGPYQGPGLVFAAPPEGFMGETGPRVALDPTTGEVAATEEGSTGLRIIGEYHGVVLLTHEDALIARDTTTGQELWRRPLAEHGWTAASLSAALPATPADGLALLSTSETMGALIDLHDGVVVNDTAHDAAVDPTTDTLVVLDAAGLHAYDADDQPLWSLSVDDQTTIEAIGGVFLYLREGGAIRVHNVITGDVAQAYEPDGQGPIIVPSHITINGASLLLDGNRPLLATISDVFTGEERGP
ncbi:PQQ-like beta-propeller repeat protein [Georgenia sp. TF02-10]|uniref:PQQ-binding-like beta-propeller repeat protein n=1 Tax=Georgenia sp. TF02-10 TaxID=2917725 RepID=UPI001FA71372|nr:PQQ-binding-like beta-propeller repeat protein [Georgenia sp. TF02-10]UNX54988.1 PQQ-like beta-propeller repeat protein [Georgenia sp. TF02-10]